jgi:HAD superfamily hydrolase (TIGR01509 family)
LNEVGGYASEVAEGVEKDPMLRAVLVDVGGTLWPDRLTWQPSDDRCLALLARLLPTLEPGQTLAALRAALREDNGMVQNTHAVLGRALQRLGIACGDADLIDIRRALCAPASPGVSLFPGAREFLEEVRDLGLRCVVLSNVQVRGADEYWRDFRDLGVAHLIDSVVTSLEVGFRKPHPAMFEAALEAAGYPPAACALVGDSEIKDIQPAVALGMRTIRVAIEEPAPDASAAHAVVTSLFQARSILAEWTRAKTRQAS